MSKIKMLHRGVQDLLCEQADTHTQPDAFETITPPPPAIAVGNQERITI